MSEADTPRVITAADVPHKDVRKALGLIYKVRARARLGLGCYLTSSCPIAEGFDVQANIRWDLLRPMHSDKLIRLGWTCETYNAFIKWHDSNYLWDTLLDSVRWRSIWDTRQARTEILRNILESEKVPFSTAA